MSIDWKAEYEAEHERRLADKASIAALAAELAAIRSERLTWAMGCECYCKACTRLDRLIRLGSTARGTSAQREVAK